MSLLNEMLHDLAKQKHAKQAPPLFFPTLYPRRNKSNQGRVFLFFLVVFTFIFYGLLSNRSPQKIEIKTVSDVQEKQLSFSTNMNSEPIKHPMFVNPPKPANLVSYIEPLTFLALKRIAIPVTLGISASNDGIGIESPEERTTTVNKVYASLTLEEWHDDQLNKALQAIDNGFDEQAITVLQGILVKMPNASDARENLASLYLAYGDLIHATDVVNEGLQYAPADIALITIKARLLLDQGMAVAAIRLLSKHSPSIMSYPDFYATLAAAFQSEGQVLKAGSLYRSLIQIDPKDGRYWLGYAIALEESKKLNQAIEAYNRASQNPETDPTVLDYAAKRLQVLQG